MEKKVILISIDGMRPDGLQQCGNPYLAELEKKCAYTYSAQSVTPSVTFPCHYSMAHSVTPQTHGITSVRFTPPTRKIAGLFETVRDAGGWCAMFYGWEPIRDICKLSLRISVQIDRNLRESGDTALTDEALRFIASDKPDFAFLYLVDVDEKGGHVNGWMSEEYMRRLSIAIDNVKRVFDAFGDEYSIVIMSDHGGHDHGHGTDMPEDMNIPLFFYGPDFKAGEIDKELSLLDIAPTIVKVMGLEPNEEWEGHSLI